MMKRVAMRRRMKKVLQSVFQRTIGVVEVMVAAMAAMATAVVKVARQEGRMVMVVHREERSVASSSNG